MSDLAWQLLAAHTAQDGREQRRLLDVLARWRLWQVKAEEQISEFLLHSPHHDNLDARARALLEEARELSR